jgi:hypothetical protein
MAITKVSQWTLMSSLSILLIPQHQHYTLVQLPQSYYSSLKLGVYDVAHIVIRYRTTYWNRSHQEQSDY